LGKEEKAAKEFMVWKDKKRIEEYAYRAHLLMRAEAGGLTD